MRKVKKNKKNSCEDGETLGSVARIDHNTKLQENLSHSIIEEDDLIWKEDLHELKKLFQHQMNEYNLNPEDIQSQLQSLMEMFPSFNSKEILNGSAPADISASNIQLMKNYVKLIDKENKKPKAILSSNNQKYILYQSNNDVQIIEADTQTTQMLIKRAEFLRKLSLISRKHEKEPLLEIEKEILFLASQYNKIQKQLMGQLQEVA